MKPLSLQWIIYSLWSISVHVASIPPPPCWLTYSLTHAHTHQFPVGPSSGLWSPFSFSPDDLHISNDTTVVTENLLNLLLTNRPTFVTFQGVRKGGKKHPGHRQQENDEKRTSVTMWRRTGRCEKTRKRGNEQKSEWHLQMGEGRNFLRGWEEEKKWQF